MKARKMVFVLIPIILIGILLLIPSTVKKPSQKDKITGDLKNAPLGTMVLYKNHWNPIINEKKDACGNVYEVTIPYEFGKRLEESEWGYIDSVITPDKNPAEWRKAIVEYIARKKAT